MHDFKFNFQFVWVVNFFIPGILKKMIFNFINFFFKDNINV